MAKKTVAGGTETLTALDAKTLSGALGGLDIAALRILESRFKDNRSVLGTLVAALIAEKVAKSIVLNEGKRRRVAMRASPAEAPMPAANAQAAPSESKTAAAVVSESGPTSGQAGTGGAGAGGAVPGGTGLGGAGPGGGDNGPSLSKQSSDEDQLQFNPNDMNRAIIAIPLADAMQAVENGQPVPAGILFDDQTPPGKPFGGESVVEFPVIIELNDGYAGGAQRARQRVHDLLVRAILSAPGRRRFVKEPNGKEDAAGGAADNLRSLASALPEFLRDASARYVFANLYSFEIRELARLDLGAPHYTVDSRVYVGRPSVALYSGRRAIYRIWPSHGVTPSITQSVSTIKADAAIATFGTTGKGIVWAVMDSGIDGDHVHFKANQNLSDLPPGVEHRDFTGGSVASPLTDDLGHGTHVAGIIAGQYDAAAQGGNAGAQDGTAGAGTPATSITWVRDDSGAQVAETSPLTKAFGVAPHCKLVSYKVLGGTKNPVDVRNVIAALEHVAAVNNFGRGNLKIHGVNMSLGYPFDPRWFACGQSPLCEVVNRLVRYGIFVVAAAGNTGHVYAQPTNVTGNWQQGAMMTVNDPGNAELAITVGSTHRDKPHLYGPSYFSSKGPTGDGRFKPDLLAPGEKIVSCASSGWLQANAGNLDGGTPSYREDSGTSMAAPHVSGAIAAFISVRQEFVGRTDAVKEIFMATATDLKRERYLQGRGIIDLLRALQSV